MPPVQGRRSDRRSVFWRRWPSRPWAEARRNARSRSRRRCGLLHMGIYLCLHRCKLSLQLGQVGTWPLLLLLLGHPCVGALVRVMPTLATLETGDLGEVVRLVRRARPWSTLRRLGWSWPWRPSSGRTEARIASRLVGRLGRPLVVGWLVPAQRMLRGASNANGLG